MNIISEKIAYIHALESFNYGVSTILNLNQPDFSICTRRSLSIISIFNFSIMNIYVANLNYRVQDHELQQLFEEYGEVSSAKIIKDHESGRSRGFAFVEMPDDEAGTQAINELDGAEVQGRNLKVSKARPRPQMQDRRY